MDINAKNNDGKTPLYMALAWVTDSDADTVNIESIKFLISKGANVDTKDRNIQKLLDRERKRKRVAIVQYLESIGIK
jgi:ankyrin repeat protein